MTRTLWTLPVPSTALLDGVSFQKLSGRACVLTLEYEDDDNNVVSMRLHFEGVETFKCTYLNACTVEMIGMAYDKVVDVGSSSWLIDIKKQLALSNQITSDLRHLMIYFDDGPSYEFICKAFTVDTP